MGTIYANPQRNSGYTISIVFNFEAFNSIPTAYLRLFD